MKWASETYRQQSLKPALMQSCGKSCTNRSKFLTDRLTVCISAAKQTCFSASVICSCLHLETRNWESICFDPSLLPAAWGVFQSTGSFSIQCQWNAQITGRRWCLKLEMLWWSASGKLLSVLTCHIAAKDKDHTITFWYYFTLCMSLHKNCGWAFIWTIFHV